MSGKMTKIFVPGGGSGTHIVLLGLRDFEEISVTAGVAVTDDGGSTARIRQELGIPAFGDLRNAMESLMPDGILKDIFSYRFKAGLPNKKREVSEHVTGNIILAALQEKFEDKFIEALLNLHRGFKIPERHRVFPITLADIYLVAEYLNGKIIIGETAIGKNKEHNPLPVKKVSIIPEFALIYHGIEEAVKASDMIIFPPGSLITSIIAALLPQGIKEAISKSSAIKVLDINIMTQHGETSGVGEDGNPFIYKASRFLEMIQDYAGCKMDVVICNATKPSPALVEKYEKANAHLVECDLDGTGSSASCRVIKTDLLYEDLKTLYVRHDWVKLGWLHHQLATKR